LDPEQVRATYALHDEVESNPAARRHFEADKPSLDGAQQQVLDQLSERGFCAIPFTELFSAEHWSRLEADAQMYTAEMEDLLQGGSHPPPKAPKPGKPPKEAKPGKAKAFMGRRYKKTPLTLASPWLETGASRRMLDIVNSYLGMWSKLSYADQWYSPPRGDDADRVGSMKWHRDYNDQHLVKVFIYLVDVDHGAGPLEYIPGSARSGPYSTEWAWEVAGESYPPEAEFAARIPESAIETFTGPKGTIIFADTSGFHRGGFATESARNLWVYNYVSPAALVAMVDRNFAVSPEEIGGRSDVEVFALT
jgi:hypothetical protein